MRRNRPTVNTIVPLSSLEELRLEMSKLARGNTAKPTQAGFMQYMSRATVMLARSKSWERRKSCR